uniref:Uncharacterized protein n=1 Tax=Cacopsylla melanoneura TaxID=428564 RepID=A0A8D8QJF5_9HEMI
MNLVVLQNLVTRKIFIQNLAIPKSSPSYQVHQTMALVINLVQQVIVTISRLANHYAQKNYRHKKNVRPTNVHLNVTTKYFCLKNIQTQIKSPEKNQITSMQAKMENLKPNLNMTKNSSK